MELEFRSLFLNARIYIKFIKYYYNRSQVFVNALMRILIIICATYCRKSRVK